MATPQLDLVIHNADVMTMDPERPRASTIGVSAGRIVSVDDEVAGCSAAREVDAGGLRVLPGFNDVHCHTTWFGLSLTELDLSGLVTLDQVYAAVTDRVARIPEGSWVVASGFNHFSFGGLYPHISVLDRVAPRHPVYIRHNSGHACIVNSVALGLAGFLSADGGAEDEGAVAVRDAAGSFTGLLEERAQQRVQRLFLPYSETDIVSAIDRATAVYATEGITSFTEAGIAGGWIGHSPIELAAYSAALEADRLHARAQVMVALDALHPISGHRDDAAALGLDLGMRTGFGNDWLKIGPSKVFLDGSLLGLTASVSEPYCVGRHGNHGYLQDDADAMRRRILDAYKSGWSIAAHAIGDRAVDLAIETLAEARSLYGSRRVPNRIEHGGVISAAQLARLAGIDVVVVPQPGFIPAFGDDMTRALGPRRVAESYRAASLLAAGLVLPGSSDRPVASGAVLRNVQAFVERRTRSGELYGADERIDVEAALRAYTAGSAAATGESAHRGRIRVGMKADLVILGRDPLLVPVEEISAIEVRATVVDGRFSHDEL